MHPAIAFVLSALAASPFVAPLADTQREQARALVARFEQGELGPYSGLVWHCLDGTEQLPRLNGCAGHGGGHMYGVLSPAAERLGGMGIYVGTVLTALAPDALAADGLYRARALVIERYLERALDGWVLARARNVRGLRQDEDEAEAARSLLIDLAGRREALDHARLVLIRLTRSLPYGRGEEALADQIRALAARIGDADPAFADLRFKIHALPDASDVAAVDAYARPRTGPPADQARALADLMRRYYDPGSRFRRLEQVRGWLAVRKVREAIDAFVRTDPADPLALVDAGAALIEAAGNPLAPATDPRLAERNLLRLHTIGVVEELWLGLASELAHRPMSRREALDAYAKLVRSAELAGLLSARERAAAGETLGDMQSADARGYARAARGLGRVLEWARARVAYELGLPLARYQAVETRSSLVVDDLLRSGVMLPLATLYDRLVADADLLAGGGHRLVGLGASTGDVRGENGGLAVGPLRVVSGEAHAVGSGGGPDATGGTGLERGAIALLRELPPDLPPVSGILTVGAPGSLSHVALLARNLGIPLAAVSGPLAAALEGHTGEPVVLGVSARRRVILGPLRSLDGDELALLQTARGRAGAGPSRAASGAAAATAVASSPGASSATMPGPVLAAAKAAGGDASPVAATSTPDAAGNLPSTPPSVSGVRALLTIDTTRLDLATTRVLSLDEISESDAGVRCGPKAAELGRLERLFPARVADAAVIPFGAFVRHVDTSRDGKPSPLEELRTAYAVRASAREDGPDAEARADDAMLAALTRFRRQILERPFPPGFEAQVRAALGRLGTPGSFGVFVRSDTNVEDLEDFTGAGLNLTVPNRVGLREVLQAVREVWASPYTERSYRWRQRLLSNPEYVFPSVLLHRTVPSEISGVVVTTDLETLDGDAVTVSAGEGVAAVVDGGSPETLVLEPDGRVRLLSSARSPTRKLVPLPPAHGIVVAAATGRDPLLGERDLDELRHLVAEVRARIPPRVQGMPWDIEFGLVRGKAYLMQIRPLKVARAATAHPLLVSLDDQSASGTSAPVALDEALP